VTSRYLPADGRRGFLDSDEQRIPEPAAISAKTAASKEKRPVPKELAPFTWKPGQSGNLSGRPKSKPISEAYEAVLRKRVPGDRKRRSYLQLLAETVISRAIKDPKSSSLVTEITDRIEGKVQQRAEISGPEGVPVEFIAPATRAELERRLAAILGGLANEPAKMTPRPER